MKASTRAAQALLEAIGEREFAVGSELPSEARLAERLEVSRLTVREAVSGLVGRGVLDVQQGRRNRIAAVEQWSVLDPEVVAVRARLSEDSGELVSELMEARRVLEVGIAELAASRITDEQIAALESTLTTLRTELDGDVDRTAEADVRFHEIIIEAAGNPFLTGAFAPLQKMLLEVRRRTSSTREVREAAIAWHERLIAALQDRDPAATAQAMSGHMDQTVRATPGIQLEAPFEGPDRDDETTRSEEDA
ncbi:FadR/GntR family transcriptional regulator [Brachybacterium endophyticum]|nr:FCD domain-containing protein [Brachybacterium endophyticum]